MMTHKKMIILLSVLLAVSILYGYLVSDTATKIYQKYDKLSTEYQNLSYEYYFLHNSRDLLSQHYTALKDEFNTSLDTIKVLKSENEKLYNSDVINYKPTLLDVKKVLRTDKIDENAYTDYYNCYDYSVDLLKVFIDKRIYSCMVVLVFEDEGHAILSIDTIDEGIIYIEPQSDIIIHNLSVGDNYCDKVNWDCDWEIKQIKSCYVTK